MPECMICLDGYTELKPLRHLKCNNHHYCEDCFCSALELAINKESNHPVPCGDTACPRLGYEDIQATLHRCTTITASRSNDLLQQYAHRLVEYNTTENRTYCSKDGCTEAHGNRRFLDVNTCQYGNGQRVQCPDCSTITCTECKQSVSPTDNTGHVCDPNASGMGRYVASLPDSERWRWRLCGRCVLWGEKADILSCNHITCEEGCGYEFCFICDRPWTLALCTHGCPKYEAVEYDDDGYNQCGYHRVTGLSRKGLPRPYDALPGEENADSVKERDDIEDDTEDDTEDGPRVGWNFEPFDDADLANEGWDNGTWSDDGGADFLDASNNPDWTDGPFNHIGDGHEISIPAGQLGYADGGYGVGYHSVNTRNQTNHPGGRVLGLTYNGWGMDAEGYDIHGFNFYGINRQGLDRNGLDEMGRIDALGRDNWF